MRKNKKLRKSLSKFYEQKQNTEEVLYGELGIPLNGVKKVDVPGRGGYVYVRLRGNNSELIEAYNNSVPTKYDYPVIISRRKNTYVVIGKDQSKYGNMGDSGNDTTTVGTTPLPNHGGQHSFNPAYGMGADPVWVYGQQFMPNVAYPSGSSMLLTINPHFYEWNGQWKYSQSAGAPSFAPYVPTSTGSARMALLSINGNSGALEIVGGVGFSGGVNNTSELAQYIPDVDRNKYIPIAAVKLTTGTTSLDYNNIYDVRDFLTVQKYFQGIGIQDSGANQGTGTILNFNDNLTATVSNGIVTINGQAGGGGGSAIIAQDEGVVLGTGTIFNFVGAGVTASISGTVFNVNIPGGGTGSATYSRVSQPTPLSSTTGTYWKLAEPYATGSLAIFNQGHALIIGVDYSEQYPQSGTYQYTEAQPTGTYHLALYGVNASGGGGEQSSATAIKNHALNVAYTMSPSPHASYPDVSIKLSTGTSDFASSGGKLNDERKGSLTYNGGEYVGWNSQNPAITFDMGESVSVDEIVVYGILNSALGIYQPGSVKIEYSDNGSDWTEEELTSGLSAGSGTFSWKYKYDFGSPSTHRYWRITLTYQGTWVFVSEIEIRGQATTSTSTGGATVEYPDSNFSFIGEFRVVSGSFSIARNINTSLPFATFYNQSAGAADGDAIEKRILLEAGTYNYEFPWRRGTNRPILDLYMDEVAFATGIDTYGVASNQITTGSVSVVGDGAHTVKISVNGKNASASAYEFAITFIQFIKQ